MKKMLIIAYYWPPSGGSGVQRWLKFVKYLPSFNISPVVYVPENPQYPVLDHSFEADIPKGITVIKRPVFEPYKWASVFSRKKTKQLSRGMSLSKKPSFKEKTLLWIRGNFFIPDARRFWVRPSVKFLSAYIKEEQIDTVITTGPPHSMHLIGLGLKKKNGVSWIADFRDPWTSISYHSSLRLTKAAAKKHKSLEKEVLNSADRLMVTSPSTKKEFQQLTEVPISVITNGYDTDDSAEDVTMSKKFSISHIGSLLTGRNPEALWQVLSELVSENEDLKTDLELQFAGLLSEEVLNVIYKYGLRDHVKLLGYISHKEVIALQRRSQLLLLLLLIETESKPNYGIIPGKLFEYMSSERPVLAIGPKGWDVGAIIRETNTGRCFAYDEKEEIRKAILSFYDAFKRGALHTDPAGITQYSRKALTEKLVGVIHSAAPTGNIS